MSARNQPDISPFSYVLSKSFANASPPSFPFQITSLFVTVAPLFTIFQHVILDIHKKLDTLLASVGAIQEMLKSQSFITENSPQPVLSSTVGFNESASVDESKPDDLEPDDELIQFCVRIKLKNVSMTNYATILVEKLFTEQERYNRS